MKVLLFLLGAVVLSPLSSTITISILHFPISTPEILFIPFLPFLIKHYHFASLISYTTMNLLTAWMFLILFGMLYQYYSVYAILGTARGYLYLVLAYLIFSKFNTFGIHDAFYACCGSIIGWLVESVFSYKTVLLDASASVSYGPMLTFPIILGFCGIRKHYKTLLAYVVIILLIGMLGGIRRAILVMVITLLLLLVYYGMKQRKIFYRYMFVLCLSVTTLITSYKYVGQKLYEMSPFIYERVFRKTVSLMSGELNTGDEERKKMLGWIIERIPESIFPKGFVSKQTGTDKGTGAFNDVPMLELEHMLGFWGALSLVVYFGYTSWIIYQRIKRKQENDLNFIFIGGYIISMVLLFLEGSFISYPYSVPITGYILGNIQRCSGVRVVIKTKNNILTTHEQP